MQSAIRFNLLTKEENMKAIKSALVVAVITVFVAPILTMLNWPTKVLGGVQQASSNTGSSENCERCEVCSRPDRLTS